MANDDDVIYLVNSESRLEAQTMVWGKLQLGESMIRPNSSVDG